LRSVDAGVDPLCVDDGERDDVDEEDRVLDVRVDDCAVTWRRTTVEEEVEGSGENTLRLAVWRDATWVGYFGRGRSKADGGGGGGSAAQHVKPYIRRPPFQALVDANAVQLLCDKTGWTAR